MMARAKPGGSGVPPQGTCGIAADGMRAVKAKGIYSVPVVHWGGDNMPDELQTEEKIFKVQWSLTKRRLCTEQAVQFPSHH